MPTDADRLLLAAAAGGDPLTADQSAGLARLLAGSPPARLLLDRLAADRRGLAALPGRTAPFGFADDVLSNLVIVRPATTRPRLRRRATWLPYATAAVVLLAVFAGAYTVSGRRAGPTEPVAKSPVHPVLPEQPPVRPDRPESGEPVPAPRPVPDTMTRVPALVRELAPQPRRLPDPDLVAAGLVSELQLPAELTARLPVLGPVSELDSPAVQAQLAGELAAHAVARLDLFCTDPLAAVTAVRAAAESRKLRVGIDTAAAERLKAKQPAAFALYTEAMTPSDVGRFLAALAVRQQPGGVLTTAHLTGASPADQRELKELVGGDHKRPAGPARDKPEATIDQVLKKVGNSPAARRPAFLFATAPVAARPAPASKELRAFIDARGERKPGTVPLLVVIRYADATN